MGRLAGCRGASVLEQLDQRLKACSTFEAAVRTILADMVALHGAEFGNVQLAVGDKLVIGPSTVCGRSS